MLRCRAVLCATLLAVIVTTAFIAYAAPVNSFELAPGVVVDPASGVIYTMNPNRGIDAIELSSGKLRWGSDASAKPMAVSGEKLLAQTDASGNGNTLPIAILETKTGTLLKSVEVPLPAGVTASVDRMMESSFTDGARLEQDVALLWWTYSYRKVSGIARPGGDLARTESGGARIDLQSGRVVSLDAEEVAKERQAASPAATSLEHGFPSSDGRLLLDAESMGADASGALRYRWRINSVQDHRQVAEVTMPTSAAPFTMVDSLLLYVSSPSGHRVDGAFVQEPLQLRAIDTKSGTERWKHPIRDINFHGALPPRP